MTFHLMADLMENHKRFIERSIANKEVWSIQVEGRRLLYESHDEEGAFVIPVWSDKTYAVYQCNKRNKDKNTKEHTPLSIELDHFINHDLYSFYKEGILVGTNWNFDLAGLEKDPLKLVNEFVKTIQQQKKINNFRWQDLTECHVLIYRLSESLAFHVIETELALPYAPESAQIYMQTEILKAKTLIHEAGYDIDELYPPESRP
jgi:hypothetical protein